jgi:hypothetical protein
MGCVEDACRHDGSMFRERVGENERKLKSGEVVANCDYLGFLGCGQFDVADCNIKASNSLRVS